MYRKIESQFWTDPKVRILDPKEKLLFLYLITNPHSHVSGIYYLPLSTISHETGIEPHRVRRALTIFKDAHTVFYDEIAEVVWCRKMLRYQGINPSILVMVGKHLPTLHNSFLINEFLKEYHEHKIPYRHPVDTLSTGENTGAVSVAVDVSGNKQEKEKDKECEEKEKPRPFLSIPEFEEDQTKIQNRKQFLMEQAKKLGVDV